MATTAHAPRVKSDVFERPLLTSVDTAVIPSSRFSVSEVLQFLAFSRRTGTVKIWLPDELVSIDVRDGHVVDLTSDNGPPQFHLGEILVRQGALTRDQLDRYLRKRGTSRTRLGRGLRRAGLINRKRICAALREQLLMALARCIASEDATVDFGPLVNPYGSVDLWIDLNRILIEAAATADDRIDGGF